MCTSIIFGRWICADTSFCASNTKTTTPTFLQQFICSFLPSSELGSATLRHDSPLASTGDIGQRCPHLWLDFRFEIYLPFLRLCRHLASIYRRSLPHQHSLRYSSRLEAEPKSENDRPELQRLVEDRSAAAHLAQRRPHYSGIGLP